MLDQLREQVRASRVSVAEIARRTGLSAPGIGKALRPGSNTTVETIAAIADAIGVDVALAVTPRPAASTFVPTVDVVDETDLIELVGAPRPRRSGR